jgi:elongation factor G
VAARSDAPKWPTAKRRRSSRATTSTSSRAAVAVSTGTATCASNPPDPGRGFAFINEVKGGNIPSEYIPAVEKGVIKAMEGAVRRLSRGRHAVTVYDGSYHDVDSSDFAFIEAARVCFRSLFLKGIPELLEPVMSVEVWYARRVHGRRSPDRSVQRRGRIESMDDQHGQKVVRGMVPLSEMFGYSNDRER